MLLTFSAKHSFYLDFVACFLNFYLSSKLCNFCYKPLHNRYLISIHFFISINCISDPVKQRLKSLI